MKPHQGETISAAGALSVAGALPLTLGIGLVLGAVAAGLLGWSAGVVDLDAPDRARLAERSATPGTDILDDFTCHKAETKRIVMRGREDGYAGTDMAPTHGPVHARGVQTEGGLGTMRHDRGYNEAGKDNQLIDEFALPGRVASGVFVLRSRSVEAFENDNFGIGNLRDGDTRNERLGLNLGDAPSWADWTITGDVRSVDLADIRFGRRLAPDGSYLPADADTLLDFVNTRDAGREVQLKIGDDTQVDFAGFALCLRPEGRRGTTFALAPTRPGRARLSCSSETQGHQCRVLSGDTPCSAALPVACVSEARLAVPDDLLIDDRREWSETRVAWTRPVRADGFATRGDVHAFCAAEIGPGWRMAATQEGSQSLAWRAQVAPDAGPHTDWPDRLWLESRTQPYANCWLNSSRPAPALDPAPTPAPSPPLRP